MTKECLDYDCEIPHHENEDMKLRMEYSAHHGDVLIDIQVPDGAGRDGNSSRITLSAAELREITFLTNRYQAARGTMEMNETTGTPLADIMGD